MIFSDVTKTFVLEDDYNSSGNIRWQRATLTVTVSANGTVDWNVYMENDSGGGYGRKVSLYLKIGDTPCIFRAGYPEQGVYYEDLNSWPAYHGTSNGGSFTTTASSLDVTLKVCCMQGQTTTYPSRWKVLTDTITRPAIELGTATVSVLDNKNNSYSISGTVTDGLSNPIQQSGVELYVTYDGRTPTTADYDSCFKTTATTSPLVLTPDGSGKYSFSKTYTGITSNETINAYIYCPFENYGSADAVAGSTKITYHSLGSKPSITIIDDEDNTFSIKCTNSTAGTGNSLKSSTLYYKIGNEAEQSVSLGTTASATKTHSPTTKITADTKVTARVVSVFNYAVDTAGTNSTSNSTSATIKFYSQIGSPSISITDNYDNTFTIAGTDAADGSNNTATTTFEWGYDTNYGNTGVGQKNLTINSAIDATRTVYAKAMATPSWTKDSVKTATTSLAIKQYVAPSLPGKPVLSYTKTKLTLKEPWTFTWTAASAANATSPLKGYYVMLLRKPAGSSSFDYVNNIQASGNYIGVSLRPNNINYALIDSASRTAILPDPAVFGFKPGDEVKLRIIAFTKSGLNNDGDEIQSASVESDAYKVQNTGLVRIRVIDDNGSFIWTEGTAMTMINGNWTEIKAVKVKTTDGWTDTV